MKLWQLTTIMRGEDEVVRSTALAQPEWQYVAKWLDDWITIVKTQDRSKLDKIIPSEFARAVLSKSKLKFFLSQDDVLRFRRQASSDKTLSAVEAFDLFGGELMEEALERGRAVVRRPPEKS